jgi:hypothetical protein
VPRIGAYLFAGNFDEAPVALVENAEKAFQGSILLGMGFTFDDSAADQGETESLETMRRLISLNPRNADRISPYVGGEEVNTSPTHEHHRYTIDFFDRPLGRRSDLRLWETMSGREREQCLTRGLVPTDYQGEVAEDWPDLIEIVRRRVKPERDRQKRDALRNRWWHYADKRPGLYRAIARLDTILAIPCGATAHVSFARLPAGSVYGHVLAVFAYSRFAPFAVLQSRFHELWARFFGSSLGETLRYTPSDCFETFPFPPGYETDPALEAAGHAYHGYRAALMIAANEGMTKTYNRFHDDGERSESIRRLRELHDELDRAVLRAYGWHDLADELRPEFLSEQTEDEHTYQDRYFWPSEARDRVLAHLLALNAERHAEEVAAGLVPATRTRGSEEDEVVTQPGLDLD